MGMPFRSFTRVGVVALIVAARHDNPKDGWI
jgi:hypothetical protein